MCSDPAERIKPDRVLTKILMRFTNRHGHCLCASHCWWKKKKKSHAVLILHAAAADAARRDAASVAEAITCVLHGAHPLKGKKKKKRWHLFHLNCVLLLQFSNVNSTNCSLITISCGADATKISDMLARKVQTEERKKKKKRKKNAQKLLLVRKFLITTTESRATCTYLVW